MDERRKYPRIPEDATVALAPSVGERDLGSVCQTAFCATRDISMGGVQVDLHQELTEGARVDVDIALPDAEESFTRSGLVAWVREIDGGQRHLTGIAFCDRSAGRAQAWRKALASRYGMSAIAS